MSLRQSWTRKRDAWSGAVHGGDLLICHGFVGAEGGQDVDELVAVVLPGQLGESAALGVHAGEIGRDGEDFLAGAEFVEGVEQVRPHFFGGHLGGWASGGEERGSCCLDLTPGLAGYFSGYLQKFFLAGGERAFCCFCRRF